MKIVILGQGNMGAPLTQLARAAGHAAESFNSKENPLPALREADLVILATKYEQALAIAEREGGQADDEVLRPTEGHHWTCRPLRSIVTPRRGLAEVCTWVGSAASAAGAAAHAGAATTAASTDAVTGRVADAFAAIGLAADTRVLAWHGASATRGTGVHARATTGGTFSAGIAGVVADATAARAGAAVHAAGAGVVDAAAITGTGCRPVGAGCGGGAARRLGTGGGRHGHRGCDAKAECKSDMLWTNSLHGESPGWD